MIKSRQSRIAKTNLLHVYPPLSVLRLTACYIGTISFNGQEDISCRLLVIGHLLYLLQKETFCWNFSGSCFNCANNNKSLQNNNNNTGRRWNVFL